MANGPNDLSRVTNSTRVIAVNTPNINTISTDWKQYRTPVDAYKIPELTCNLKPVTFSYIP